MYAYELVDRVNALHGRNGAMVDATAATEWNEVAGARVPMPAYLDCWEDTAHGAGVLAFAELDGICVDCGLPELMKRIDAQYGGSFAVEVYA